MKILLRPHLKMRLKERNIPQDYPSKIVSTSDEKYFDTAKNHKPMAAAYDIIGKN